MCVEYVDSADLDLFRHKEERQNGDESYFEALDKKAFKVPYGKMVPCTYEQEDKSIYGLTNDDGNWEDFAL